MTDSSSEELRRRQWARAEEIARTLTGGKKVTRGIVQAMYALVVADERPDPQEEKSSGVPAAGAREVLKSRKREPRKTARVSAARQVVGGPDQGALW